MKIDNSPTSYNTMMYKLGHKSKKHDAESFFLNFPETVLKRAPGERSPSASSSVNSNTPVTYGEGKHTSTFVTVYLSKIQNAPEKIELRHGSARLQNGGVGHETQTLARLSVNGGEDANAAIQEIENKYNVKRATQPHFLYKGQFKCSHEIDLRPIKTRMEGAASREFKIEVVIPKTKSEKEAEKPTELYEGGGIQGKGASKLLKAQKKPSKKKTPSPKKTRRPAINYSYIIVKFVTKDGKLKYAFQVYTSGTVLVSSEIGFIGARQFFEENIGSIPGVFGEQGVTKEELIEYGRNNKIHPIATGDILRNHLKKNQVRLPTREELNRELKSRGINRNNTLRAPQVRQELTEYFNEYVRPGANGSMRVYKLKKNSKTGKPSNKALQSARGKMINAYRKSNKNIPNVLKNYFGITESPKKKKSPKVKMLPASKNNVPKSVTNKKPGFYAAPNPQGKLQWYQIPQDVTAGRATMEKRFAKHKMNIPQNTRNLFKQSERSKKHQETRKKTKENVEKLAKEMENTMIQQQKNNLKKQLKNKLGKSPSKENENNLIAFYNQVRQKNKKSSSANIVNVFAKNVAPKYKTPTPAKSRTPTPSPKKKKRTGINYGNSMSSPKRKTPPPPRLLVNYGNLPSPSPKRRTQSAWESAHKKLTRQQMTQFTNAAKKELRYNSLTPTRRRKANQLINNFNHMFKQGHLSEKNALNSLKMLI